MHFFIPLFWIHVFAGADPRMVRIGTGPPFWQINHANSAYFRLFLGYFRVISATRPPLLTYPGSTPVFVMVISKFTVKKLRKSSLCKFCPLLNNSSIGGMYSTQAKAYSVLHNVHHATHWHSLKLAMHKKRQLFISTQCLIGHYK